MISLYWIYEIPNWELFLLMLGVFAFGSLGGLYLTRPLVRRMVNGSDKYNDLTNYYFAAIGVLYGLSLGLIAVGTWENFSEVDAKVAMEANSLGALYRDIDGYPPELRQDAENLLRDYATVVIEKEWPAHREGNVLDAGEVILDEFENKIMSFEPTREVEKIAHAEVIKSLSDLVGNRGFRVQSVNVALPGVLWGVVLVGAIINIGLTYCFWVDNLHLHSLLVVAFASMLAMLIFLTAAMDNPFRGQFSVSPDALQYVRDHVMTTAGK
ncbi:MAG TPA: DUF4239 domain-containing protein [Pirellulales bacterium]|jgi:hypothetical protein